MQGAQLAELEILYKEEQVLRKRYYNTIEGNMMFNNGINSNILEFSYINFVCIYNRYEGQDKSLLSNKTSK